MLVINERTDAPKTEQLVAEWLRTCHVPGLAVAGAHIPGRRRGDAGQEADFIVFTPNTAVCIEVKGTLSPSGGVLHCPVNGRWSMTGHEGDPVHVRSGDVNPLYQAKSAMYALKALTENATGAQQFVSALVVIVARGGTTVDLDKPTKRMLPKGVDIMLGNKPNDLFTWFQRGTYRKQIWTISSVRAMLEQLGVNDPAASSDALAQEGFSGDIEGATPRQATSTWMPIDTRQPYTSIETPSPAPDPVIQQPRSPRPSYLPGIAVTHGRPPHTKKRVVKHRRRSAGSPLLAIVALAVIGGGAWYVVDSSSGQHNDRGTSSVTSSAPVVPNELPAQVETTEPSEIPAPQRQAPQGCYPFQPNC
ncbi:nuclease-related domain-containing protein [Nocardia sp. SYP-A9097]|uniref:nuclease-related domain-containing protein n=1 Tax=Nocardia sp. SYP-A9097 TaxID=2663237 RepID=UPI001891B279|nr:nuclease-related domain-containing protein [Nocardia sp. SYP-A9097]